MELLEVYQQGKYEKPPPQCDGNDVSSYLCFSPLSKNLCSFQNPPSYCKTRLSYPQGTHRFDVHTNKTQHCTPKSLTICKPSELEAEEKQVPLQLLPGNEGVNVQPPPHQLINLSCLRLSSQVFLFFMLNKEQIYG